MKLTCVYDKRVGIRFNLAALSERVHSNGLQANVYMPNCVIGIYGCDL